jgi:hypothetical protein
MNKEKQDQYVKDQVNQHNSEISPTTQKAVDDAIKGVYEPPMSERGENTVFGALVGVIGGPLGIIVGAGLGASTESAVREEYDYAYGKAKAELKRTNP